MTSIGVALVSGEGIGLGVGVGECGGGVPSKKLTRPDFPRVVDPGLQAPGLLAGMPFPMPKQP